jgi:hypothetical protein
VTKRIEKLTPEQESMIPSVRDEWLGIGFSTAPADREAAVEGARAAYRAAGLKEPEVFVWLESPYRGAIGAAILATTTRLGQVRDQVWGQVWGQVWDQVWGQVRDQVRDQVGGQVRAACYGQHDAGWLAFYDYFGRQCGIESCDLLAGQMAVAKSCGWWWPFEGLVIFTERPVEIHRDVEHRLHCDTGMAIRYPDDWGIWAVHGTRVTEQIVMKPETLTTGEIMQLPNAEQRRVAIDRFGWDRYVEAAELRLVDECPDPCNDPYTLKLYDVPEQVYNTKIRVLLCTNASPERDGTRRRFGLTVPANRKTAISAAAWLGGMTVKDYKLLGSAA